MSTNQYTLLLKVDDTSIKEFEQRLKKIFSGNSLFGSLGGNSSDQKKNIVNIALIASRIGALVISTKTLIGILKESSPMLQSMFKLLNYSIMLIFRPIGDFVGFILRPIIILFLRKFIIPWFKDVYPKLKELGNIIGGALKDLPAPVLAAGALGAGALISIYSVKAAGRLLSNIIGTALANGGTTAAGKIKGSVTMNKGTQKTIDSFTKQNQSFRSIFTKTISSFNDFTDKLKVRAAQFNSAFRKLLTTPKWVTNLRTIVDDFIKLFKLPTTPSATIPTSATTPTTTTPKQHGSLNKTIMDRFKNYKNPLPTGLTGTLGKVGGGVGNWGLFLAQLMGEQSALAPTSENDKGVISDNGLENLYNVLLDIYDVLSGNKNPTPRAVTINVNNSDDEFIKILQTELQK